MTPKFADDRNSAEPALKVYRSEIIAGPDARIVGRYSKAALPRVVLVDQNDLIGSKAALELYLVGRDQELPSRWVRFRTRE